LLVFPGILAAQEQPSTSPPASATPSKNRPQHPVTEAEVRQALSDIENFTRDVNIAVKTYQENLKAAMETYGRGLYDQGHHRKISGFGDDLATGDPEQTEKLKLALFACMLQTAHVRLDPDPLRYWAEIERRLAGYPALMENAREQLARANIFVASSSDNIPPNVLKKLRSHWRAVANQAERARDHARMMRPVELESGQTFSAKATEGPNLRFNLFGVQFGRELGNVKLLAQLTYLGKTESGSRFLLSTLAADAGKTRVDTVVRSRAILVHTDPDDALSYGYAVTSHDYGAYRVLGARVADVASNVQNWVWKALPPAGSVEPAISDLERAIADLQDSRRAMDQAADCFRQLSVDAVRQNDDQLKSFARQVRQRVPLPEQDLKDVFPDVRARLHAVRALIAGDPRFISSVDQIANSRRQATLTLEQGRNLFSYFNGLSVDDAPQLPWKSIDRLGSALMQASIVVERAAERAENSVPTLPMGREPAVTAQIDLPPNVIVTQMSHRAEKDRSVLIVEHILRDVHWVIKGMERRQYTSELIHAPASGLHTVEQMAGPEYVQGPGGIAQVFEHISNDPPASDLP